MAVYDSGGKQKDHKKYKENYDKIFGGKWPCKECGNNQVQGHKLDCSNHWRNK
jgi:hypothetical protein